MANYIGFLVNREVSYDPTKYEEYAAAAVKFIRRLGSTDAMFEQVRLQADHVRTVHEGAAGNISDLND